MRRPDPLPSPSEQPAPSRESAPKRSVRAKRRDAGTDPRRVSAVSAGVQAQDEVETAVDLDTLDDWANAGADAAGEAQHHQHGAAVANAGEPDGADAAQRDGDEQAPGAVRWHDVWRAARARRRSLRAEVRRFTVRSRRRRIIWISTIAALVVLIGGSVATAYSPLFAVQRITVVGAETLDATSVEAALSGTIGVPLAAVDDSAVKAALVAFPMIETYALEAHPPHELVVRITERIPVGVVASEAGFTLVDVAGVTLATTAQAPAGQPVITADGGPGSEAFTAAGLVVRSLPAELRSQVTAVSATTAHDVTLTLGGSGTAVVWGSADDSALKAVTLQRAMLARTPDTVSAYDVSSPGAVVISGR